MDKDDVVHVCLSRWLNGKESVCQCRRHRRCRFDPWVRKIPWRRKWQPTPVFLPGKSHGQRSLAATVQGVMKSPTRLSIHVPVYTSRMGRGTGWRYRLPHESSWIFEFQVEFEFNSWQLGAKEGAGDGKRWMQMMLEMDAPGRGHRMAVVGSSDAWY